MPDPIRRRARAGFSLMELMIAVTLIALLAGLALPRYDPVPSRADAGMRLVRTSLQLAQRMAIQHQHDMIVSFDVAQRRVRVAEDSTDDGAVDAAERERWLPLEDGVRLVSPPAALPGRPSGLGVAGAGVRTIEGLPSVIFRRNGAASGDVVVYLAVTGPRRTEHRAVTVLHSTGRTDWFRYRNATWTQGDL